MERKHIVDEINLTIDSVKPFVNDNDEGFDINWCSDIGFGTYRLYHKKEEEKWYADIEFTCGHANKDLLKKFIELLAEQIEII